VKIGYRVAASLGAALVAASTAFAGGAFASAGPRTNGDITYYLNGTARTVVYQWNEIAYPCGDFAQSIVGGPYDDYHAVTSGSCYNGDYPLNDQREMTTTYNYNITGAGHDEYQSGSVTFTVS
jgi:hypothetical protein